jgi:hypothetical protein
VSILVELGHFRWVGGSVSKGLGLLVFLVSGYISKEEVICDWAEEEDRVEEGVGVEDKREREVDENVAEVAVG